jgi:hypothetical protein
MPSALPTSTRNDMNYTNKLKKDKKKKEPRREGKGQN